MFRCLRTLFVTSVAGAIFVLPISPAASAQPPAFQALLLTDLHFDPFVDAETASRLKSVNLPEWRELLHGQRGTMIFPKCGETEAVTDPALLISALKEISNHEVAFTVLSGDLFVHEFQCRFNAVFPGASQADYLEFAAKTAEFLLTQVRKATHGRPVYFALGNHDSGCGNYRRDANDEFLRRIAPAVGRAAGTGAGEKDSISRSFASNGRYEVLAPLPSRKIALLIVDTTLWSRRGSTCNGAVIPDDEGQLAWLHDRTAILKRADQTVWLVGHIPPGIDPRASSPVSAVRFLRDDGVAAMLSSAPTAVDLALFGHTHMDEWRLFGRTPVHISPALSPSSGNRPSFTLAHFNERGAVSDFVVVAYNETSRSWRLDHSLQRSFGVGAFDPASLSALTAKLKSGDKYTALKYNQAYSSGGTASIPTMGTQFLEYTCAISSVTTEEFLKCARQSQSGSQRNEN